MIKPTVKTEEYRLDNSGKLTVFRHGTGLPTYEIRDPNDVVTLSINAAKTLRDVLVQILGEYDAESKQEQITANTHILRG